MGREVGSWMRDVWQDARKFRQCRKAKIGRDASWWDDHTCTMASGSSLRMERMVSALVTASREANNLFRKVSYCSHSPRFDAERDIPDVETSNWRAVCGKTASTVRREGRRESSLPLSRRQRISFLMTRLTRRNEMADMRRETDSLGM